MVSTVVQRAMPNERNIECDRLGVVKSSLQAESETVCKPATGSQENAGARMTIKPIAKGIKHIRIVKQ